MKYVVLKVSDWMKTAILSDIHGNDIAFEAVVQDLKEKEVNCIIFLGDLVAKGAQPQECFDRMMALKPLVWLKGNTEYWLDDAMMEVMPTSPEAIRLLEAYDYLVKHMDGKSMDYLIGLTHMQTLKMGHYEGVCCHGSPRAVDEVMDPIENQNGIAVMLNEINGAFILSGHSHKAYDTVFRGIRMINPGSVGNRGQGIGIASYALMDTGSGFQVSLVDVAYDYHKYDQICKERSFMDKVHYWGAV